MRGKGRRGIVIIGPYSSKNLGDYAMLVSMLKVIREFANKNKKTVRITVYSRTPELAEKIITQELGEDCSKNIEIRWARNLRNVIISVLRANTVIVGGGSLFYKKRKPIRYALILLLAKLLGKRTATVSVDGPEIYGIVGKISIFASDIFIIRVPEELKKLPEKSKNNKKILVLPDIAVPYLRKIKPLSKRKYECCAVFPPWIEWHERRCTNRYQELPDELLAGASVRKYFMQLGECEHVITYHYHTALYCKIHDIPYEVAQDTEKMRSVTKFSKEELAEADKKWREVFERILTKNIHETLA